MNTQKELTKGSTMGLALLTVAYNSNEALIDLAMDLRRQTSQPNHWLIVDNSPDTPCLKTFDSNSDVLVIKGGEDDGFAKGCNRGLDVLRRQGWDGWVWLLNPDTRLFNDQTLEQLYLSLEDLPQKALVGTAVIDQEGCLEKNAGWIDPGLRFRRRMVRDPGDSSQPLNVDWVSGCSLLLKPFAHEIEPRFDEFFPLYYEDIDLCLRLARRGVSILWLPNIRIRHHKGHGSITSSARRLRLSTCSYIRFLQRHRPWWVVLLRSLRLLMKAFVGLLITPMTSFAVLRGLFEAIRNPPT